MRVQVKICGITNLADARYISAAGADYLGFVQYENSPRYISTQDAGELIEWVFGPQCVGVFVNETADVVNEAVETAKFDLIQLHGDESVETCADISCPVIKAVRIGSDDDIDIIRRQMDPFVDVVSFFLLDARSDHAFGGTGQVVNWDAASTIAREYPLFLAGGITPENVASAVTTVRPVGIDLSSGVEITPGRKDFEEIDHLFAVLSDMATDPLDTDDYQPLD